MKKVLLVAVWMLLVVTPSATAQSTDDGAVFDFSLPGARSRGMGGAFVAVADDASSVYSNPAGLTSLFRPEISLEGRVWQFRYAAIDRGHAYGDPSRIGIDTLEGLHDEEFSRTLFGLGFFSAVYPSGKWAIGLFHHQLVNYQMSHKTDGAFFQCVGGDRGPNGRPPFCEVPDQTGVGRLFPATWDYEVGITSSGIGGAYEISNRFKLGGSVQVYSLDLHRVGFTYNAREPLKFSAPDWSNQNIESMNVRVGKDREVGFNVGALLDLSRTLTLGGTFRQGRTFKYAAYNISGPANPPGGTLYTNDTEAPFRLPDTWAVGIAYKPSNTWRVGLEYDRVRYEQLKDAFVNTSLPPTWPEALMLKERLKVDDSNQFRVGGEYSRPIGGPLVSFRAGLWTDPFHQPYLDTTDAATGLPAPGWTLLFPKRDGQIHYSGGVGVAAARHWQADFAVDYSRSVTTYSLSSILRF